MEAERSKHAIARIEAALARIEAAPVASGANDGGTDLAALSAKHARLRDAVQTSLEQLDQLIEGAQG